MHKIYRLSPKALQNWTIRLSMLPFLPWRRYLGFSLTRSKLWNSKTPMKIFNPSTLHDRQIERLNGNPKGKATLIPNGKLPDFLNELKTT